MATKYVLLSTPIWNSFDLVGRPAGGAQLFSWVNNDRTQPKKIFRDPDGQIPYTNPIDFDENGEAPHEFYFADDTTYFLQLFEAPIPPNTNPTNGILIWQVEGYGPSVTGGSGGGNIITENFFVENLLVNNPFYYNIGSTPSPITATSTVLAPGSHDIYKPDIQFVKSISGTADHVDFIPFDFGVDVLGGDVTPEYYLQYTCVAPFASEDFKGVQIPINKHVTSLSGEPITISVEAKGISGLTTLYVYLVQDYGNGGAPTATNRYLVASQNLTSSWGRYVFNTIVPNVSGGNPGTCGNDGLYLHFGFPIGQASTIAIAKPAVYVGTINPSGSNDFDTYDKVDSRTNSPRTGDIRTSLNAFYPFGWAPMNDGTIGNASSNATTRKNKDTFQLYDLIWNNFKTAHESYAPMYTNAGIPVAYGASSFADFDANNQLSLTKSLGRVLAGTSPLIPDIQTFTVNTGTSTTNLVLATSTASEMGTGTPVVLSTAGTLPTASPVLVAGTVYYTISVAGSGNTIKLARTLADALAGNAIVFSGNGSGSSIVVTSNFVGSFAGENTHVLTVPELPTPSTLPGQNISNTAGSDDTLIAASKGSGMNGTAHNLVGDIGSSTPFSIVQPTTFMNVFIKL